jgi:hypothetical protein
MRMRFRSASRRPIGMNGWTSPREPTIMMTMDKGGTRVGPPGTGAAATSPAWRASHRREMADAIGGRIEAHLQTPADPGRDGLEPADGGGPQTLVV